MPFPNPDTQFQPGQSGNPAGKPKGVRMLSSVIQEMMDDDTFEFEVQGGGKLQNKPSKQIVAVMVKLSNKGNIKAADWLAKYGYGTKVDVTTNGQSIQTPVADPALAAEFLEYMKGKTESK